MPELARIGHFGLFGPPADATQPTRCPIARERTSTTRWDGIATSRRHPRGDRAAHPSSFPSETACDPFFRFGHPKRRSLMPKKSAAALSIIPLRVPRLRPPADLPEAQAAIWRTVVESLPAEHFRRVDSHLLRSFVEVTARLREAEQSLRLGVVHGDAIHPSLGVYERAVRLQMALARSLRIATSSRVDKVSAGANARRDSSAQPWRYDDLEGKTDPPE